jgi:hypothetical protein
MKKIRRNKPFRVIIYMYIYIWNYHKEIPCVATFILNKLKCIVFFCFIFSLFSSTKSENRKAEQVVPRAGGLAPVGGARSWGKECRKVNMEKQNACTTTKGKMLAKLARLFFFSRDL